MRSKSGIPVFAWILLALLALSAVIIRLSGAERTANPSAMSFRSSGLKAYADLLTRLGYKVEVNVDPFPDIGGDAVAVVSRIWDSLPGSDEPKVLEDEQRDPTFGARKAVVLEFSRDYAAASAAGGKAHTTLHPFIGARGNVGAANATVGSPCPIEYGNIYGSERDDLASADYAPIWTSSSGGGPFAVYRRQGDREQISVADGIGATNRFIAQQDNAAVFVGFIRALAKPGGTVVFVEASIGNTTSPSLIGMVGSWALAAWWQLVLLGIVVAVTLGKRFGIADALPFRQRGTRELVDALSDVYKRSRADHVALQAVVKECDRRIRQALKLSRDAKAETRNALLPPNLVSAFAHAEAVGDDRPPPGYALKLAQALEDSTNEFLGARHRPARRGRRSR